MNILLTALLTTIAIGNMVLISVIAWALKNVKNNNSRVGGVIMLSCLIIDLLVVAGGVVLW